MKTLLSLFMILAMGACSDNYQKPFIIIRKTYEIGRYNYEYRTANNTVHSFQELTDKYNVGDTLR